MTKLLEKTEEARRRRKAIALTLAALTLILLVVTALMWVNLPDEDPGPMIEDLGEAAAGAVP